MNDRLQRKQLTDDYKRTHLEAGVYRIVNSANGKSLLDSAVNLASARNRFGFAQNTKSASALDMRLKQDVAESGFGVLSLEVLETLQPPPEATAPEIRVDLDTLVALWRERLGEGALY